MSTSPLPPDGHLWPRRRLPVLDLPVPVRRGIPLSPPPKGTTEYPPHIPEPNPEHELRLDLTLVLPTDYQEYGGTADRDDGGIRGDCSCGCRHFRPLYDPRYGADMDWGVCLNPKGPRAGLLTFEHQAGAECFDPEDAEDPRAPV